MNFPDVREDDEAPDPAARLQRRRSAIRHGLLNLVALRRVPGITDVLVAGLFVAAGACGTDAQPIPPFPEFVQNPEAAPVISSGRTGLPMLPVDPGVYVDAEGYHLFYSTPFCLRNGAWDFSWDSSDPSACDVSSALTSITYAFSPDRGRTWELRRTPVMVPGASGFDALKIETAAPFRLNDTLYVAYSATGERDGVPFDERFQIGLAHLALQGQSIRTALLGGARVFERRAMPLLPYDLRAGRFDNNVQEPSVVVRSGQVELYYIGLGLTLPDQPIGATGQGLESIGLGRAVFDLGLQLVSRSESALLTGVNIPEVRYFDGAYHLISSAFAGGEVFQDVTFAYSRSVDGLAWSAPRIILAPGGVPGFDDWGLMAATAAVEENRVVLLYTVFGSATGACQDTGPDARFGISVAGGARCVHATIARAESTR